MEITTLGIDLAKSVFQLHRIDVSGTVVLQKKLRRGAVLDFLGSLEPCLIGMEACPTSHFSAREIARHPRPRTRCRRATPFTDRGRHSLERCSPYLRSIAVWPL